MLPNLGGWEWVIIAVVALILFGGARLANFGKNAGKAIREFKEETSSLKQTDPPAVEAPPPAVPIEAPPARPPVAACCSTPTVPSAANPASRPSATRCSTA